MTATHANIRASYDALAEVYTGIFGSELDGHSQPLERELLDNLSDQPGMSAGLHTTSKSRAPVITCWRAAHTMPRSTASRPGR